MRRGAVLLLLAALVALVAAAAQVSAPASAADPKRPNVVVILTDDQTLAELNVMPQTQALIGGQGVTFERAYSTYPLCCPARATLLTGQYMHNHGVRGNVAPAGGWERFSLTGTEARALPVWMQETGYTTVQAGKYLNGYPQGGGPLVPPGWDEWYGKLSEYSTALVGNSVYFNYTFLEQGPAGAPAGVVSYGQGEDDYQTDVMRDKAVAAIRRLGGPASPGKPFFLNFWFSAPHAPYVSATRDSGIYSGAPVPKTRAVNEKKIGDKPRMIRRLNRLKQPQLLTIQQRHRDRWAQLLSMDQAVGAIVEALAKESELENTYVIFTSDNGYFSGEHRIAQGKYLPHEPASHVPLLVRGPGIPAGGHSGELVGNIDIAPTIAAIAGVEPKLTVDGRSLLPFAQNPGLRSGRPILLEGDVGSSLTGGEAVESRRRGASGSLKGKKGVRDLEQEPIARIARAVRAPAYRAIRTDRYLYVRYAQGGFELYDMLRDPLQLNSLSGNKRYRAVRAALDAHLAVLRSCAGASCGFEIGPDPVPPGG